MGITKALRVGVSAALLAGTALFGAAGTAWADDPSSSPSADGDSGDGGSDSNGGDGPTEAGTSFRTAVGFEPGQRATAAASTGEYLYWKFLADTGQRPTVKATVKLPEPSARKGTQTWQVDVYDGLRRRQACMYGAQTRKAAQNAESVSLSCTLRPVRAWSEQWSDDPLPGTYYVRLTVTGLKATDLGLPVQAEVETTFKDVGGSHAVDGSLAAPLVAGNGDAADADSGPGSGSDSGSGNSSARQAAAAAEPEDGWASGWWSDRWLWTAAGGFVAALTGVGGYCLARGPGRPRA
ncbi:hypothetical protein [Streptomyces apocyni]|uniref:hypothetical protein n=1 Tax=Streptomyces apocyni TaxID=2654677 RepID=UPI0012E9C897|nr:hypothetical protein [Streptomyces apocyni]